MGNTIREIRNTNFLMKDSLKEFSECLDKTLEGRLYAIPGRNALVYLFTNAGFFIVLENNKSLIHKTIDATPLRKYQFREVTVNNMTAYLCKPEDDKDKVINYDACFNWENMYVLSGKIIVSKETGWYNVVDVYDVRNNFKYKYSYSIPVKSPDNYAYSINVNGDYLYLYLNKEGLKRYKITIP